jgi:hypothetical protein
MLPSCYDNPRRKSSGKQITLETRSARPFEQIYHEISRAAGPDPLTLAAYEIIL